MISLTPGNLQKRETTSTCPRFEYPPHSTTDYVCGSELFVIVERQCLAIRDARWTTVLLVQCPKAALSPASRPVYKKKVTYIRS